MKKSLVFVAGALLALAALLAICSSSLGGEHEIDALLSKEASSPAHGSSTRKHQAHQSIREKHAIHRAAEARKTKKGSATAAAPQTVDESPITKNLSHDDEEEDTSRVYREGKEFRHDSTGYLYRGNSLKGMPLKFSSNIGHKCWKACLNEPACHSYTYHPEQSVCYLKALQGDVHGRACTTDCWYSGYVSHEPLSSLSIRQAKKELGLVVKEVKKGQGKMLHKGETATISYVGKLDDGTVFDSGKYVFTFGEHQVIDGDEIGLEGMRVGGERRLIIPSALGYGNQGYPGSIPARATLHFDVKLVAVSPTKVASGYKED